MLDSVVSEEAFEHLSSYTLLCVSDHVLRLSDALETFLQVITITINTIVKRTPLIPADITIKIGRGSENLYVRIF